MLVEVLPYVLPPVVLLAAAAVLLVFRRRRGNTVFRGPGAHIQHTDQPPLARPREGNAVDRTRMKKSKIWLTERSRTHISDAELNQSEIVVQRRDRP